MKSGEYLYPTLLLRRKTTFVAKGWGTLRYFRVQKKHGKDGPPAPYYTVPQGSSPTNWGYWPTGAMNRGTYGNGVIETTGYNNRSQISSIADVKGSSTLSSKTYSYLDSSGHNNGNILSIADVLSSIRNQTFSYDSLNRIATGSQADNAFNITYSYDPWGNMKESGTSNFVPVYDISNRIQSPANCNPAAQYCYDAAGNLLIDNKGHSYVYDAEARIKSVDGTVATYTYGPDGERVRKDANGVATEYVYFQGNVIAEKNPGTGAWTDYIFGYGKRLAKDTSTNGTGAQYYQDDQLGSARIMTDSSGTVISNCTFNPFGEQVGCSPDNPSNHYRFTGKERDSESGLDNFAARYYGSTLSRFMNPDELLTDQHQDDPQSWNLFSYVRNNPLRNTDPTGKHCINGKDDGQDGESCADIDKKDGAHGEKAPPNVIVEGGDDPCDALCRDVFHTNQARRTWGLSANVSDKYIAEPLIVFLTFAVPGAFEAGGPAITTLGIGRFMTGQIIERVIMTSQGPVGILAQVEVQGSKIILKDVAIYPLKSEAPLSVGVGEIRTGLRPLMQEMKASGFKELEVKAYRISGINPGRTMNLTIKLK